MQFIQADSLSLTLFVIFAIAMAAVIVYALRFTTQKKSWLSAYAGIVALFSIAAASGLVLKNFVPVGPFLFISLIVFSFALAYSKAGLEIAQNLTLATLIGFQGFRFPLEVILHRWAEYGTVPGTMTWTGQNWDLVTGIVSIIAIPVVNRYRWAAITAQMVGFMLLLNVIRVVLMSSPLPFAWQLKNPILLLAFFPYVLIGPLFVMPALIGHLITFRKLFARPTK